MSENFNTQTSVAGVIFGDFCMNASGIFDDNLSLLTKIAQSQASGIVLKSTTLEPRIGNPNPKYLIKSKWLDGTLNSMGLPNSGIEETTKYIQELKKITQKPIIASISGFSLDENLLMYEKLQTQNLADLIEINLSCPNLGKDRLVGYDLDQSKKLLLELKKIPAIIPFGLKFPPFLEEHYFKEFSELLLEFEVKFITCTNSLGNCLVINPETERVLLKPNFGRGGLGGKFLKPIALANVATFYRYLKGKVDIIGVGGIGNSTDAFEFLLAGASCVQLGSSFANSGFGFFEQISEDLKSLMLAKKYTNFDQARGKLKYIEN